ncbi:MAG: nucleotide sugar dehydrogenase [Vulcanimicrobiaceae bacterium]
MTLKTERTHSDPLRSIAPDGTSYELPSEVELASEIEEIRRGAAAHRARGGSVVAVQGLGFVGSAVAAVIAAARDASGRPTHFVIGTDLATPESYWKIAKIRSGQVPIPSPDTELSELVADATHNARNLVTTSSEEAYALADVIVVDLPLDVTERFAESAAAIDVRLRPFERALESIGRHMREDALVLVETTVPIGVCERVARPLLTQCRAARGLHAPVLLAHAYERVMPGPHYVDSIKRFWRTFSGVDDASSQAARAFLTSFVDVDAFPLRELDDTNASELAKVLENSYRAVNIAFMYEWTLLAEKLGVNLFEIVDSIRVRKGTHDNMRYPGFGVGGYCLTKDSLLAQWSATSLFATDVELRMTLEALRINHEMPLHTLRVATRLAGGTLVGYPLTVAGVSYLAEVADTRNSPTEVVMDELARTGGSAIASDPYLSVWHERPHVPIERDLAVALAGARGVIFAVPHRAYTSLSASALCDIAPKLEFVVDAFNVIGDDTARALHRHGIRVAGVGKGHWNKMGLER